MRAIPVLSEAIEGSDAALQRRVQELELCIQSQAREIRALEKIEGLLDPAGKEPGARRGAANAPPPEPIRMVQVVEETSQSEAA